MKKVWLYTMLASLVMSPGIAVSARSPDQPARGPGPELRVGLNGQACAFSSITAAVTAAQSGDSVYIEVGGYNERIGFVNNKDLALLASVSGSNCTEQEIDLSRRVLIDGTGVAFFGGIGGIFHFENSAISLNQVDLTNGGTGQGGLVFVRNGSLTTFASALSNGTVSTDRVNPDLAIDEPGGGCIFAENSTITLLETTFNNCRVIGPNAGQDPSDGDGGAIHARQGSIVETGESFFLVSFDDNSARNGGAIALFDSSAVLAGPGLRNNTAVLNGGAIFSRNSTVEVTDTAVFEANNASIGGAISLENSDLAVQDPGAIAFRPRFNSNSAAQFSGAIDVFGDGPGILSGPLLDSVDFTANISGIQGGAVSLIGLSDVEIVDSVFDGNSSSAGGAIYQQDSASTIRSSASCKAFLFDDPNRYCSEFRDNAADTGSAIAYGIETTGDILTSSIRRNSGPSAVQLLETSTRVNMESVWMHDNAADAVVAQSSSVFEAVHVTLTENGGSGYVGLEESSLSMFNSIAFGNVEGGVSSVGTGSLETGCNFDQSGQAGPATDPLLVTNSDGAAHLGPESPAMDTCQQRNAWPLDLDGRPRVFGGAPDAGTFEANDILFDDSFE